MRKVVLMLSFTMLASLSTAHSAPNPVTNNGPFLASLALPISAPMPSCKVENVPASGTVEQMNLFPPPYHGYCYSDCSSCWSNVNNGRCADRSICTQQPLC
jgi:hypothetical protein